MVGVRSGVTTVVDQGGPSCMTLPGFRHFVAEKAETRVYAFLSAYLVGGLEGHFYPNLYSPDGVDVDATVASANANTDIVRGIKGHMEIGGSTRWGIRVHARWRPSAAPGPACRSTSILESCGACRTPAPMARTRTPFSNASIPGLLKPGRRAGASFTCHPGGFVNRKGEVHKVIRAVRSMKATEGRCRPRQPFSYRLACKALDAGVTPHTLGADMHGYNTEVPAPAGTPREHADDENHLFKGQARFSLTQAMSSMMALGLPLESVVPLVTSNPAEMLGLTRSHRRAEARARSRRHGAA